jgi:uncharacterized protein (TIGR03437 family)
VTGPRCFKALARLALASCLWLSAAYGHYPFVHYTSNSSPYNAVPEKFDLKALPNQTLYYFVSPKGPESYAPGDSFASILSQIRLAARAWSEAENSGLRFEFGGLSAADTVQTTPGVDVWFGEVELPPGLIALGGPTSRSPLISTDSGAFVPITRSILVLGKDLSQRPSHSDAFFLTVVHELGHALGLQHTLTSSTMSTEVTRSTTRAKPLAADDAAGISSLYPAQGWAAKTGSISGRVTLDGQGVHLASVVALDPAGSAVSALTDPDGSYKITGLRPGQYYLYVHPLPPGGQTGLGPADIVLPRDPQGNPVPAGPLFETLFYPNGKTLQQAAILGVEAGKDLGDCNFEVTRRASLEVYGVKTYSFPGSYAVSPAFINVNGPRRFLVAYGNGLITNNAPSAGLRVQAVGGSATVRDDGLAAYAPAPSFLQVGFSFNPFGAEGPRHLIFSLNGDIYVLPAGVHLVRSQPPSISSAAAGTDAYGRRTVVLSGSNLVKSTRILFDGLPAAIAGQDATTGALTVIPPPGASGHSAVVTALDSDGQDSLFLDAASPAHYVYETSGTPSVAVSPASLPAATEAMVEITGVNTNFSDGQTLVGFGSSDIAVRRVWVTGPGRLLANVHTAENAQAAAVPLTVVTGFQIATQPSALQIQPARPGVPVPNPVVVNPSTGRPSIYAGGQAAMEVAHLPLGLTPAAVTVTLDGVAAEIVAVAEDRITFAVPASLALGPAVLRLTAGGQASLPIVVAIDPAPPVIKAVEVSPGQPVGAGSPARLGGELWVTVSGLADTGVLADPSRVSISLGGVVHTPQSASLSTTSADAYVLRFTVSPAVAPGAAVPLTVAIGERVSQPVAVPVASSQ